VSLFGLGSIAMRAGVLGAVSVQTKRMVGNHKALGQGHIVLPFFNLGVVKLFNFAAV
jgi:hypothetical protein